MNIKKVIAKCGSLIPIRTYLNDSVAREILTNFQACPQGSCFANNVIEARKDLQIIIPAYNAEKYIGECLKSVLCQKTKYSVLATVINDGSTDNTAEVIQNIVRGGGGKIEIEVISQENRGFSGARNAGLKTIKGKYIMFLDSDDILPDNTIEIMIDAAYRDNTDIVQGSWYEFDDMHRTENIVSSNQLSGVPWGKIYKAEVLQNFQFPEGYWFEDTPITFILTALSYRHKTITDVIYGYRLNPNGITARAGYYKKSVDTYWVTEKCLEEFPLFDLPYDQRAYEFLLQQSIMNARRTFKQPRMIRKSIFVLTNALMKKYFNDCWTNNLEMEQIEQALKKKQFIRFEMLVHGI